MAASYAVCGLGLQSNVAIAALKDLPPAARIDVRVTLGALPPEAADEEDARDYFIDTELDDHGAPSMRVARLRDGRYYRLAFSEGVTIVVDARGESVWATWSAGASEEEAASYLTGAALGFVLRLRGVTCIHGAAIAVGGRAVALVGPSGSGKSSTAAAFARLGYAVLTDDLVALRETHEGFGVQSALPRVHLWPESAGTLVDSWASLPRIAPRWDKRRLDLAAAGFRFQQAPLALAAIYFLGSRDAGHAPEIAPLGASDALIELVSDSHAAEYVDRPQRAEEFDTLARLLRAVPARRVTPCEDLARVPALCEAIVNDLGRLRTART